MKQLIARTLTSLLLAVGFLAGIANGQATSWVVKVNIPFEFNVGNKTFPAGSYSLAQPLQLDNFDVKDAPRFFQIIHLP